MISTVKVHWHYYFVVVDDYDNDVDDGHLWMTGYLQMSILDG